MPKIVVDTSKSCDIFLHCRKFLYLIFTIGVFRDIMVMSDKGITDKTTMFRYYSRICSSNEINGVTAMKRILVFSDTHGSITLCRRIIDRIPCDMIIHAGDYVSDAQELKKLYPDKDIQYVKGNCDMFSYAPSFLITELDGVRIFISHGHEQRVKYEQDYSSMIRAAKTNDCRVAVFGHTHIEYAEENDGVYLLNPGSAKYGGTYGVIEIEDGEPAICFIDERKLDI